MANDKTTPIPFARNLRLLYLTLRNFKGCTDFTLSLAGSSAAVYGDNAAGKTTLYDGLTWLLFGKDSSGASKFNIKPLDEDGNVRDHGAETEVAAAFDVDGQSITLSRSLKELWTKKRGRTEATFDGHTTEFFYNGLPVQKGEFERRVGKLCDEATFRQLTDVRWFCVGESEKKRREALFSLIGGVSEEDVLRSQEDFAPLGTALGGLTVEEFRVAAGKQRRTLQGRSKAIPARIDEQQRTISEYSTVDFDQVRAQRDQAAEAEAEAQRQMDVLSSKDGTRALEEQKKALQAQLDALDAKNNAHRAAQRTPGELHLLGREIQSLTDRSAALAQDGKADEGELERLEEQVQRSREEWVRCNNTAREIAAKPFDEDLCPTCGQPYPPGMLEERRAAWEGQQRKSIDMWTKLRDEYTARAAAAKKRMEALNQRAAERREEMECIYQHLTELTERSKAVEAAVVEDLPGYQKEAWDIQQAISQVDDQLRQAAADQAGTFNAARFRRAEARDRLRQLDGLLACEGVLKTARERVEELRSELREVAAQVERLDGLLDLCDKFTRAKSDYITREVNSCFRLVSWQLYEEQINGGLRDCCKATVAGVPYADLNNGAQVNAGLDVIRTLSAANQVTVPLFIDNAESVTALEDVGTQVIRLVVSAEDKALRVEVEG